MNTERPIAVDTLIAEISRKRWQCVAPLLAISLSTYVASLLILSSSSSVLAIAIWGKVNLAYVIAISQFIITFLTAIIYTQWVNNQVDVLTAAAHRVLCDRKIRAEARPASASEVNKATPLVLTSQGEMS